MPHKPHKGHRHVRDTELNPALSRVLYNLNPRKNKNTQAIIGGRLLLFLSPGHSFVSFLVHGGQVVARRAMVLGAALFQQLSRARRVSRRRPFPVHSEQLLRKHVARIGQAPVARRIQHFERFLKVLRTRVVAPQKEG